jgi:hypothetical protein
MLKVRLSGRRADELQQPPLYWPSQLPTPPWAIWPPFLLTLAPLENIGQLARHRTGKGNFPLSTACCFALIAEWGEVVFPRPGRLPPRSFLAAHEVPWKSGQKRRYPFSPFGSIDGGAGGGVCSITAMRLFPTARRVGRNLTRMSGLKSWWRPILHVAMKPGAA